MIFVVDVVGANIRSLESSLLRLKVSYKLTHKAEDLKRATHVILAGVGSAEQAMHALNQHNLTSSLKNLKVPVLGICSGMQILYEYSEEAKQGPVPGLALLPGTVTHLPSSPGLSLPHSGWNRLIKNPSLSSPFDSLEDAYVYFVHSYHAPYNPHHTTLYVNHGVKIPALVCKDHYWGAQFHPEKSAEVGHEFLRRFCCL